MREMQRRTPLNIPAGDQTEGQRKKMNSAPVRYPVPALFCLRLRTGLYGHCSAACRRSLSQSGYVSQT